MRSHQIYMYLCMCGCSGTSVAIYMIKVTKKALFYCLENNFASLGYNSKLKRRELFYKLTEASDQL